jgi:hypothetical protein
MNSPDEVRATLRESLLLSFETEFEHTLEAWKTVEAKAQANVTISGIFLAAGFAYARETRLDSRDHVVLLFAGIICLTASVISSLLALRIVRVPAPPLGESLRIYILDLLRLPDRDLGEERLTAFVNERAAAWRGAIDAAVKATERKASHVWHSQVLLGMGMVLTGLMAMLRLI